MYQDTAGQAAVLDVRGWMLPLGPLAPGSAGRLKAFLTCTHMMLCVRSSFLAAADGDYEAPREQRAAPELHQQFPLEYFWTLWHFLTFCFKSSD